jgi:hypothetical protein
LADHLLYLGEFSFGRKEPGMFGYLTHVSDGKRLEMFPWTQTRRRLTECERTEREWINQELESEAGATEPQFRIDMVPESEEGSHFRYTLSNMPSTALGFHGFWVPQRGMSDCFETPSPGSLASRDSPPSPPRGRGKKSCRHPFQTTRLKATKQVYEDLARGGGLRRRISPRENNELMAEPNANASGT